MARRLSSHRALTSAVERLFVVGDSPADPGDRLDGVLAEAGANVAASTGRLIAVVTVQETVRVDVVIETWDSAPPPPPAGWAGPTTLSLTSRTGRLMVDQTYSGPSIDDVLLPAGPGRYTVEVFSAGRDTLPQRLAETRARLRADPDFDDDEIVDELDDRLAGEERYLLRVWPTPTPQP